MNLSLNGNFIGGTLQKAQIEGGKKKPFTIEGIMTDSSSIDLENEVIDRSAFPSVIEDINKRAIDGRPLPIVIEHRRQDWPLPVGGVIKAWDDNGKLRFKAVISDSPIGKTIQDLISEGWLYGCSMGGDPIEKHVSFTEKGKKVNHLSRIRLDELSLTGIPVRQEAVFALAKSLKRPPERLLGYVNRLEKAIEDETSRLKEAEELPPTPVPQGELSEEDKAALKSALDNIAQIMGVQSGQAAMPPLPNTESQQMQPLPLESNEQAAPPLPPTPLPEQVPAEEEVPEPPVIGAKPAKTPEDVPSYEEEASLEGSSQPASKIKTFPMMEGKRMRCTNCQLELAMEKSTLGYDANFCPQCGAPYEHMAPEVERIVGDMVKSRQAKANSRVLELAKAVKGMAEEVAAAIEEGEEEEGEEGEEKGDELKKSEDADAEAEGEAEGDLKKSEDTEEEAEGEGEENLEKSEDAEAEEEAEGEEEGEEQVEKALGSVAIAHQPKGTGVARKTSSGTATDPSVKGKETIAIAKKPSGTAPKFVNKSKIKVRLHKNVGQETGDAGDSGEDQDKFKGNFVPGSKGHRQGDADTTMHEHGGEFVKLGGGKKFPHLSNYSGGGKDAMSKSLRIVVREALGEVLKSEGISLRKSLMTSQQEPEEQSTQDVQEAAERVFAAALMGRK